MASTPDLLIITSLPCLVLLSFWQLTMEKKKQQRVKHHKKNVVIARDGFFTLVHRKANDNEMIRTNQVKKYKVL